MGLSWLEVFILLGLFFMALLTFEILNYQKIPNKTPIKTCENLNQQKNSYEETLIKENKKNIYYTQLQVLRTEKEDPNVRIAAINAIYKSDYRKEKGFQDSLQNISGNLSENEKVRVIALETLSKI